MTMNTDGQLKSYKKFQKNLSREDFARHFSHPFLVFDKDQGSEQEKQLSYETVCMEPEQLARLIQQSLLKAAASKVTRLVKKGTKVFTGMINVGRTTNCDVVIDSPIVSKFHAYFARDTKSASFYLSDANSTNGTLVNNIKLKPKVKKPLSDGNTISFDRQVTFSFYTPEGLYDLLKQIPD